MPHTRLAVVVCSCAVVVMARGGAEAQTLPAAPVAGVAASAAPAQAAVATSNTPGFGQLFTSIGTDFKHLATRQNLFIAGIGLASSTTAHRWDADISSSRFGAAGVTEAFEQGQLVGNFTTQAGAAFATYLVGRMSHSAEIASLGSELFRAQLLAQTTTQILKVGARRTRPDGTTLSFPSGHAAAGFATASVLQSRYGWKAGAPAYAVATWIAASRVQSHRHYLSDVIAGATIGILAGRSVTIGHGAGRFSVSPMPVSGGMGINLVHVGTK